MKQARYGLQLASLFVLYFITAKFGLSLGAVNHFATLVWIPTGVSIVALFLFGYRLWPSIAAGAFVINLLTGAPLLAAGGIALGNTFEALVGAYLLKKLEIRSSLDRLHDILVLIFIVALGSTLVSATVGTSSLLLSEKITSTNFASTWIAWWVGDILSVVLVTPLLLVWSKQTFVIGRKKRFVERIFLLLCLVGISLIIFKGLFGIIIKNSPVTYLISPLLTWIALRFTQREVVTAVFILAVIAVWGTATGQGPFAYSSIAPSLFYLQGFIGVTAITSMIIAAVVSERKELERRKNEFITMASHELKTPITIIKLYTQLLQKQLQGKNNKKTTNLLTKYNIQIDRLTMLVNDLLDISKITAGKLEMKKSIFAVNDLVKETVAIIKQSNRNYSIVLQGEVKGNVYGDKVRISQVLINFMTNAMKYSPTGSTIKVQMKKQKKSVVISVQDMGVGIAKEHQEKIFDRFYQVNPLGNTSPGLGIGLYLCRIIIKRHQGEIGVKSKLHKGSIFFFSLPLR